MILSINTAAVSVGTMQYRSGELSTPLKILLVAIAAVAVVLMIVSMQDSLIGTAEGALGSFITGTLNG